MDKKKQGLLVGGGAVLLVIMGGLTVFLFSPDPEPEAVAVNSEPVVTARAPLAPEPLEPLPPQPKPLPPVEIKPKPVEPGPRPAVLSAAFRAWTNDARVTGVLSGTSPRAIINGRLVRPGDMVDASEGIIFEGVDQERKELIFRNRDGVFTTKPY